jgi:hypothetical protein
MDENPRRFSSDKGCKSEPVKAQLFWVVSPPGGLRAHREGWFQAGKVEETALVKAARCGRKLWGKNSEILLCHDSAARMRAGVEMAIIQISKTCNTTLLNTTDQYEGIYYKAYDTEGHANPSHFAPLAAANHPENNGCRSKKKCHNNQRQYSKDQA